MTTDTPAAAPMTPEREAAIRKLEELIARYWSLAFAEGREGREQDTDAGDAQQCWHDIQQAIHALSAPVAAPVQAGQSWPEGAVFRDIDNGEFLNEQAEPLAAAQPDAPRKSAMFELRERIAAQPAVDAWVHRAMKAMEFHEYLLRSGHPQLARDFVSMGLMDEIPPRKKR